jgi:hypothetical protein
MTKSILAEPRGLQFSAVSTEEHSLAAEARALFACLDSMPVSEKVRAINAIRAELHKHSPFFNEPVHFVKWVPAETVQANDYNPNSVAPPEMELLRVSVMADGYTQPIVTHQEEEKLTVVDGFHRNRVGKECADVYRRIHGYLPVVQIKESQSDRNNRIASTIRHNRARGKHKVDAMSDIVLELKRRNWENTKIAKELGMDEDEILRLCQITGLADLFSDSAFSEAWDIEGAVSEEDFVELSDDVESYESEITKRKVVNTTDETRIFHTYDKWECYQAGFYDTTKPGWTRSQCEHAYKDFLSDLKQFEAGLESVISEWKHSCEHYLTNSSMNRIAWLGQAACCYKLGIPSTFRSGFSLLTEEQQQAADLLALRYLNKWLTGRGMEPVSLEEAYSTKQSELY